MPLDALDRPSAAAPDAGLSPRDAMLATMRWAHRAAEAAGALHPMIGDPDAAEAFKTVLALRKLALAAAKAAAPYVHVRKSEDAGPPGTTHEDALAELERLDAAEAAAPAAPPPGAGDGAVADGSRPAAPAPAAPPDPGPPPAAPAPPLPAPAAASREGPVRAPVGDVACAGPAPLRENDPHRQHPATRRAGVTPPPARVGHDKRPPWRRWGAG